MARPSTSRRRLLRSGAALGTATLAGLAGCSTVDLGPLVGGDEPPAYATWLPAPDAVFLDPADAGDEPTARFRSYYPFSVTDWSAVGDRLEAQDREAAGQVEAEGDDYETAYEDGHVHPVLPVGPRDAGLEVSSNRGLSVFESGMDDSAVAEAFEQHRPDALGFARDGEYEGWTLLRSEEGDWTVGVRDGTVVEGFLPGVGGMEPPFDDTRDVVEGLVEARAGEARYVDAADDLAALVSHLGTGAYVNGSTRPAGLAGDEGNETNGTATATDQSAIRATGQRTAFEDGTTRSRYVAVFESAETASVDRVTANGEPWSSWEGVETTVDGRVVVAEGTNPDATSQ
jgi:hypothetical protein